MKVNELSVLVPPFSWFFRDYKKAVAVIFLIFGSYWLFLVISRKYWFITESFYWSQEIILLLSFCYIGSLSPVLAKSFHNLLKELSGKKSELDELIFEQERRFHRLLWLVLIPFILSVLAISLRFIAADYLFPFKNRYFEYLWLGWLFLGFFMILNTTVLCARYTELIRKLGKAAESGIINRPALVQVSRFYFRAALFTAGYFAFSVFTVFSLHIIYTYSGNVWPGYAVLQKLPKIIINRNFIELAENSDILIEVILILLLNISGCIASIAYFLLPQWGIHILLKERKQKIIELWNPLFIEAENALNAELTEATAERFARVASIKEQLEKIPEWPFSSNEKWGTLLLFVIPAFLVFLKEVFLEVFVGIITK